MHLKLKRVASTAMAVVMSLGLSVTAFAAQGDAVGNQTLTVNGAQLKGKDVTIVKMFDATITEAAEKNEYEYADYTLIDAWDNFFTTSADETPAGIGLSGEGDALSEAAVNYVQGLDNSAIATFADKAQTWYRAKKNTDLSEVYTKTETGAEGDTVTFTDVAPGYYLVFPEGGSTGNDERGTDAILVNVPSNEYGVTVNIKSTYPTVDKKVDTDGDGEGSNPAADNGSAQVGDIVTFTLTSKVPDMSDYTTFYFAFNDTLSSGLEFVKAGDTAATTDVTVTIGEESITSGYTVSLDGTALKVEFTDLKSVVGDPSKVGKDIVVTYQAMITEAATSTNPATNEVKVEYSNDPTTGTHGTSTPDESKVYTYDIDVNKWAYTDATDDGDAKIENLAGAKFKLTTDKEGNSAINLVATDEAQTDGTHNAYRVAKPGKASVTEFVTNNVGDITISGLEAGNYYLHEIEAPAGYNKLKAPVKIEIVVSDSDYEHATIKVDGSSATGSDGTTVDVENKKGIELPETGSIGTIGLTIAGVAIVLLGVFAPRKKKKGNQE